MLLSVLLSVLLLPPLNLLSLLSYHFSRHQDDLYFLRFDPILVVLQIFPAFDHDLYLRAAGPQRPLVLAPLGLKITHSNHSP